MYILVTNIWFTKLMKQFFFWVDKIVFNFISIIYDVMISIARTSVFTQSDIADMADRIYKLLAIFMIFKVTLSLITYVVNPDDFSDKSKGVSKLGINIIISMALLILTPYIFSYAYQFQTIILEDNSLGTLIFGGDEENDSFFNTAGDKIAYTTLTPFFTPNTAIEQLYECATLIDENGKFNQDCSGLDENLVGQNKGLHALTMIGSEKNDNFSEQSLKNYVVGVENGSLGLMFREEMVSATYTDADSKGTEFIMEYKFIFSTVTGVIIILLLITFCMDIAVRSIKLAFLQLVAPIPIISYVDPKSGKDGLFKKWYEMCIKTYLSLFIRLIALYFAVFIISKVAGHKLVDVVDGSYVGNGVISIFIIIGALMFAKQLPKMLEGLGIKLDGDGKFFLNPFKKFEEQAIGGKNITGMARGALIGTAGALTGAGIGRGISGAWRGLTSGKGWKETGKAEAEMNRKMRQAKLDGSTFSGRMGAKIAGVTGFGSTSENIAKDKHKLDEGIRKHDDVIKAKQARKKEIEQQQKLLMDQQDGTIRKSKIIVGSSGKAKDTMNEKLKTGKGQSGLNYNAYSGLYTTLSQNIGKKMNFDSYTLDTDENGKEYWRKENVTRKVTQQDIDNAKLHFDQYADDIGWRDLTNEMLEIAGFDSDTGEVDWDKAKDWDAKMATNLQAALEDIKTVDPECDTLEDVVKKIVTEGKGDFAAGFKKIMGANVGAITTAEQQKRTIQEKDVKELDEIEKAIEKENVDKEKLEEQKRALYEKETAAKANESIK